MRVGISRSSDGAASVEAASSYLASEPHYLSAARRILAALGDKGNLVLVTGDPPADPQSLARALRQLAGPRHRVIGISCGPDLTGEEVSRAGSVVAMLPAGGGTVTISDTPETDAPLFVFDEADELSEKQLAEDLRRDTIRRKESRGGYSRAENFSPVWRRRRSSFSECRWRCSYALMRLATTKASISFAISSRSGTVKRKRAVVGPNRLRLWPC